MKIKIQCKHWWSFWFLAIAMWFVVALPFTIICMALVSGWPFWMWQSIFMFFAALMITTRK